MHAAVGIAHAHVQAITDGVDARRHDVEFGVGHLPGAEQPTRACRILEIFARLEIANGYRGAETILDLDAQQRQWLRKRGAIGHARADIEAARGDVAAGAPLAQFVRIQIPGVADRYAEPP